jgi:5-methylcytosine-specific restriction endonuclease McrA
VGEEEFVLDGVDVAAARSALARLGAEGAPALDALSTEETIALLTQLQRITGAVAAVQARALVQLETVIGEDCRRRGETPRTARLVARAEASAALKTSTAAAGQSMSSCRRLVRSMPGILTALAHGGAVPAAGHQVARAMGPATPEQRSQVDQVLTAHLAHLEDCGPGEWADEAARVLHALDPAGAAARHQEARRERSVTVRRGHHGMATLTAHLGGLDAARIRKSLSVAAEKARAGGDRRGHQQIMADLFADTLLGRGEGGEVVSLDIGVIIADRSLLAPAHADAATVEGLGSVPYEHVREEMRRALDGEDPQLSLTLRRLYEDLEDGQLVAVESRAREFPRGLARFVRYAHQTCRAPHCDASIRQIDHIVPSSQGGKTSLANANGLCAAHNQKEEAGTRARVITDEDGVRRTVEWTTRHGQKARRRGIDYDPVGTAIRQREQEEAGAPDRGSGPLLRQLSIVVAEREGAAEQRATAERHGAAERQEAVETQRSETQDGEASRTGPAPGEVPSRTRRGREPVRPHRIDHLVLWHLAAPDGGPRRRDAA